MRNILDYGAIGDGVTINTKAIQQAIDDGGMVFIPDGVFITGTLYLKSGGGLYLSDGATLKMSGNLEDIKGSENFPQNGIWPEEGNAGWHMLLAIEQEDIRIEGNGTIDGNGTNWVAKREDILKSHPGQMIMFCECKKVSVKNVTLQNSSFWHLFFHGCTDVTARDLYIRGNTDAPVNDGIDIDCCQRVTVSGCNIETGDDALTVRCDNSRLKTDRPCEDVIVNNCILRSTLDNGIRVGVGSGKIKNCIFSDIIIRDTLQGININGRFNPAYDPGTAQIENISFKNIILKAYHPIDIQLSNEQYHPPMNGAYVKNITFSDIKAECERDLWIWGYEGAELENIKLINCDFLYGGKGKDETFYNENGDWLWPSGENAITIKKAKNVILDRVNIKYTSDAKSWKEDVIIENSENVRFIECELKNGIKND